MKLILYLCVVLFCVACTSKDKNEKWQSRRSNIVDVKDDVKEIDTEDVLIGAVATPYICGNYLAVIDYNSVDKLCRSGYIHPLLRSIRIFRFGNNIYIARDEQKNGFENFYTQRPPDETSDGTAVRRNTKLLFGR